MGFERSWVGIASLTAALAACKSEQPAPAPAASAALSPSRGFLPKAALAECRAALDVALRAPATLEGASTLMIGCASMIANHGCRAGVREVLAARPVSHPREAVQRCANAYCPTLPGAADLAACRGPMPLEPEEFGRAHAELGRAMFEHDLSGRDAQEAMEAWSRVVDYVQSVPPPRFKEPPVVRVNEHAVRKLHIKVDGVATLRGAGPDLQASSIAEYAKVFPRAAEGDTSLQIVAETGIAYADLIAAMDALRELGYEHISFGTQR